MSGKKKSGASSGQESNAKGNGGESTEPDGNEILARFSELTEKFLELQKENEKNSLLLQVEKQKTARLRGDIARFRESFETKTKEKDVAIISIRDVMDCQQVKLSDREATIDSLRADLTKLKGDDKRKADEIKVLKEELEKTKEELEQVEVIGRQKMMLEDVLKKQDAILSQQTSELAEVAKSAQDLKSQLTECQAQCEILHLRAQSQAMLRIIGDGEPWLIEINRHKLCGDVPVAKYANGIQVLGDRYIAVCGGRILREHRSPNSKPVRSKNDETEDAAMPLLDMTSMTWESIKLPSTLCRVAHSSSPISRSKFIVLGGHCASDDVIEKSFTPPPCHLFVINAESQRCHIPPLRCNPAHPVLCRRGPCLLTLDNNRDTIIFGGEDAQGKVHSDIHRFSIDEADIKRVDVQGPSPQPRREASAALLTNVIWIFGGADDSGVECNDVFALNWEEQHWIRLKSPLGQVPCPRRRATLFAKGESLLLFGGLSNAGHSSATGANDDGGAGSVAIPGGPEDPSNTATNQSGGGEPLHDLYILNTAKMEWSVLATGLLEPEVARQIPLQVTISGAFDGRLYVLCPNRTSSYHELRVVTFTDGYQSRQGESRGNTGGNAREDDISPVQIMEDATSTPNSIQLKWKTFTKVCMFSLLVATRTGMVREVYKGKANSFTVAGLHPNTEYIFSVKVEYSKYI